MSSVANDLLSELLKQICLQGRIVLNFGTILATRHSFIQHWQTPPSLQTLWHFPPHSLHGRPSDTTTSDTLHHFHIHHFTPYTRDFLHYSWHFSSAEQAVTYSLTLLHTLVTWHFYSWKCLTSLPHTLPYMYCAYFTYFTARLYVLTNSCFN